MLFFHSLLFSSSWVCFLLEEKKAAGSLWSHKDGPPNGTGHPPKSRCRREHNRTEEKEQAEQHPNAICRTNWCGGTGEDWPWRASWDGPSPIVKSIQLMPCVAVLPSPDSTHKAREGAAS